MEHRGAPQSGSDDPEASSAGGAASLGCVASSIARGTVDSCIDAEADVASPDMASSSSFECLATLRGRGMLACADCDEQRGVSTADLERKQGASVMQGAFAQSLLQHWPVRLPRAGTEVEAVCERGP